MRGRQRFSNRREQGFTLIEIISVIILLSIVSVIGGRMIITTTDSYNQEQSRSKLVQKGRQSIERMVRQLRIAVPNSIRVSGTGNCIEFMPLVAGANYLTDVADSSNGAPLQNTIVTAPFDLGLGAALHVVVAPFSSDEIYTTASTAARVGVGALGAAPITSVPLGSAHRFVRNTINKRVFIGDTPARFCVTGTDLVYYSGYEFNTGALGDGAPGGSPAGSTSILSQGVSTAAPAGFVLSPGTQDRNSTVDIHLQYSEGGESVVLNHTVFIRNVP